MERLRNPRFRFTIVLGTAAAMAAVLVGASQVSARDAETPVAGATEAPAPHAIHGRAVPAAPEPSLFAGIEQRSAALGAPKAPVTLVEYADLQCPYCAQWARDTLPTLVEDYVKTGKLRIVFNGMAFLGPDSDKALRTAVAAGTQDRLWDVVHSLYLNQGHENAGWVTDELVDTVAAESGLDGEALLDRAFDAAVTSELERADRAARAAGVHGTPTFQVGPTGGSLELVQVSSLGPEGIIPAIEGVLGR